jgi:hypothetical protein
MNKSTTNEPTRPMTLQEMSQTPFKDPVGQTPYDAWGNKGDSADYEPTRPMSLSELPPMSRIDHEMAIIRKHNERVAKAIDTFWGHRNCVEYLEQLLLNGGDGAGKARIGFKHEVMAALITLASLHEVRQS